MKFDYYIFNTYSPETEGDARSLYSKWLEQVELAEELGMQCAWFTEHHFHSLGGMLPNPQVFMAAAAQRTRRIRLGTAVTLLALHNPLRIAEDLAMVDVLTDGRLDVGVGRGMEWINYAAFGSDYKTAQDRLEESIFVLQKAWTGEEFAWEGRFFECGKVRVMPTPVQQPHPPIWMTANRDANHFRWIGEQGFHLMTIPWTLPKFDMAAPLIAEYRDALCQAGHDLGSREVLTLFPVYVSDTDESARREVDSYWAHMRDVVADARGDNRREGTADELIADNRALFGSPQTVRRLLERIRDELQPTRLCLHFQYGGLPQELTLKSMRLFMAEVAVAFGA